jgi:hypothetical protein
MKMYCKLLTVALTSMAIAGAAQAQTTLRYKFKEGDKLEYVVDQDQKIAMNVLGMDIDMTSKLAMGLSCNILQVDDKGNAKFKVTLDRVKMVMEGGPFGKIEIDSKDKDEPDNPIEKLFSEMVKSIAGLEMSFTADNAGNLSDVKLSELKKMKKVGGAGLPVGGTAFGPDTLKSLVEGNVLIPLPKEPISKGKSWTNKINTKTDLGKVAGENTYTYEGDENDLVKLAVKPDMKIDTDPNAKIQMKVKSNKGKGHTLFDNQAGRIAGATSEATMEMEIEAMGQTIDLRTTQTTTLRLKGGKKSER